MLILTQTGLKGWAGQIPSSSGYSIILQMLPRLPGALSQHSGSHQLSLRVKALLGSQLGVSPIPGSKGQMEIQPSPAILNLGSSLTPRDCSRGPRRQEAEGAVVEELHFRKSRKRTRIGSKPFPGCVRSLTHLDGSSMSHVVQRPHFGLSLLLEVQLLVLDFDISSPCRDMEQG